MKESELMKAIEVKIDEMWNNYNFTGFSTESIQFFEDYPQTNNRGEEWDWWRTKSGTEKDGDYWTMLKPEFTDLLSDIAETIHSFDSGIEMKIEDNLGEPINRRGPLPHCWGAIHTKNRDKRIDVQFFINLAGVGMRVGIFIGSHDKSPKSWNRYYTGLFENKSLVFEELKKLENIGYKFISTNHGHYIRKSEGEIISPESPDAMLDFAYSNQEFDVLKIIDNSKLNSKELIKEILTSFVETRRIYEMLQLSNYSPKSRNLILVDD